MWWLVRSTVDRMIVNGDCVEVMAAMDECSVDAVVTDPPYGLEFMGKEWDSLGKSGVQRKAEVGGGDRRAIVDAVEWGGGESSPYSRSRVRWQHGEDGPRAMQEWHYRWAVEALRVLKPGGHLLAFGGTRTSHRLACALEDAGFEIRDTILWVYGTGFPKSLDVSKAIDKAAGAEREMRVNERWAEKYPNGPGGNLSGEGRSAHFSQVKRITGGPILTSDSVTPDAEKWEGWGTALKPAQEPIIVARKPLVSTVAANVLKHGTGALNIDACRIETADQLGGGAETETTPEQKGNDGWTRPWMEDEDAKAAHAERVRENVSHAEEVGRWPANLIFSHAEDCVRVGMKRVDSPGMKRGTAASGFKTNDETFLGGGISASRSDGYRGEDGKEEVEAWECSPDCPVAELDRQAPTAGGGGFCGGGIGDGLVYGDPGSGSTRMTGRLDPDGGASRFFYAAKSSRGERNVGLKGFEEKAAPKLSGGDFLPVQADGGPSFTTQADRVASNHHPTVKPISVMRWLLRLVTPPDGLVLDPFAGSGSTGCAALLEPTVGRFVGIEQDPEYVAIAEARIAYWRGRAELGDLSGEVPGESRYAALERAGQTSLFG